MMCNLLNVLHLFAFFIANFKIRFNDIYLERVRASLLKLISDWCYIKL